MDANLVIVKIIITQLALAGWQRKLINFVSFNYHVSISKLISK